MKTAVEWLIEYCDRENWSIPNNIIEQAKQMEKEQMIEFACKVVKVSSENYIQGKITEQIAKELLTFKSE